MYFWLGKQQFKIKVLKRGFFGQIPVFTINTLDAITREKIQNKSGIRALNTNFSLPFGSITTPYR